MSASSPGAGGSADRSLHDRVRRRLRMVRAERGLTQAQVAAAAGMDTSTLSRLESGARRVTLDHLPPLARALGVSVDHLLSAGPTPDPRVRAAPVRHGGITYWPLTREPSSAGLRAFKIDLPQGPAPTEQRAHEGHEWIYVLSGRVRLWLGEEEHVVESGEAAEFSTWTPHAISAVGGSAEVLAIFGPQGERIHLRE